MTGRGVIIIYFGQVRCSVTSLEHGLQFCLETELTREPRAPLAGVGMKAMRAVRAVLTDQEGCQCSGWCAEMERQILTPVSNLPLGVSSMKAGGLKG